MRPSTFTAFPCTSTASSPHGRSHRLSLRFHFLPPPYCSTWVPRKYSKSALIKWCRRSTVGGDTGGGRRGRRRRDREGRVRRVRARPRPTAAIPMASPECSCKLTRVRPCTRFVLGDEQLDAVRRRRKSNVAPSRRLAHSLCCICSAHVPTSAPAAVLGQPSVYFVHLQLLVAAAC